ncbi:hypothetical protein [Rhizobium sp. 2MFCol3.1]|uniref:hypothetical protein n=1 Tax=Rhizobium sp. 2MFCol3.1 TaxID=1246459 RepID=UPI0003642256
MGRISPFDTENATATGNAQKPILAPELAVSEWFNTPTALMLSGLRGRPIFLHSFQLLCPGCVSEALPQVKRIERAFGNTELQVIGIHTVFEHHAAMTPVTLRAFLHEYRISSPVAVDMTDETSDIPVTMQRFGMRGTPSSILIGRDGAILSHVFGVEDDLVLGARIAMALNAAPPVTQEKSGTGDGCADGRCDVPAGTMAAGR